MKNDRKDFLTKLAGGALLGLFAPSVLQGCLSPGSKGNKERPSKYPRLKCDVAVVGAGPGGVPAAIAAARQGAKVILIEEDSMPGGAPVDMYVPFICGNPRIGVFREMVQQLNARYPIGGKSCDTFGLAGNDGKNHWWLPGSYAQVIYGMLAQEPNITLLCGAPVVAVSVKADGVRNRVTGVRILRNGEYQDIDAAVTVDATGTGLVADLAGCEYMYGSEAKSDYGEPVGLEVSDGKVQPCTWMFISERIKRNAVFPVDLLKGGSQVEDNLNRWVTKDDKADMVRRDAGVYLHWGKTVYCKDTRDPLELANAQQEAFEKLRENMGILHKAGYAVHLAPKLGVREVRRIKGEYVLTATDLINGVFPEDTIAHAHYALDVWGMKLPEAMKHIGPYGIPYRSLLPLGTEGLITAGRIISATRIAHSSLRVQPICSNIGMAAGTAAAMAALRRTGLRSLDMEELRKKLAAQGLFDGLKQKKQTT